MAKVVCLLIAAVLAFSPASARTLRWASQGDSTTMDPHSNNETFNNNQNNQVYEYLSQRDKQYRIVPWLATSWESPAPNKWLVRLRKDVRFHDGTPLTADDVVFSFDRAREANSTFKLYATQAGTPRRIDDHTVEFTTATPNPVFHESINTIMIISRAWAEKNGAVKAQDYRGKQETYTVRNAMGTGPYKLVSFEPGVRTRFAKNPEWWGIKAGLFEGNVDAIEYRPIGNSSTRMAALRSGDIDFVLDPPVQEIDQLRADKSLKVWEGNEVRVIFIGLDQGRDELLNGGVKGRNPLKDKRVRQAMYQAIDIQAIRKQVMRGLSVPTAIALPDPAGAGVDAALDRRLPFDPPAAKKLLQESGFGNGFPLGLDCPNDRYINDEKICVAIAAMWSRIGIDTRVNAVPRAQFFPKLSQLESSAYLYGWGGGSAEAIWTLKPVLHRRGAGGAGDNNFGRFGDERIDKLIDAIEMEMDTKRRHAMVNEAMKLVHDEIVVLPLHRQVIPWVSRRGVSVVHRPDNNLNPAWVKVD